ncbi:LytR/AlgR family response regulator transcription factor [Oleiharenicola lentus]|uniref:LytR/AlgR family response regulator transcription factor n=1 Tax=Oleiharenicola lentus TaxID=2508720 RepID=UPI003F666F03
MIRALIIDDEAPARQDLHGRLAAHPHLTVVGEAMTIKAARALLEAGGYDLVFLDVQLIGGSGFDLVPSVKAGARIIFVTGFSEYAVRAFEVNAIDYLVKPVKPERLAEALVRVNQPLEMNENSPVSGTGNRALNAEDLLHLNAGTVARFAPVADVAFIVSDENYSRVWLVDGTSVLVRRTLKSWEERLAAAGFQRVHRAAIVNLAKLKGYRRDAQGAIALELHGVTEVVPVGRNYWPELKSRLPDEVTSVG